MRKRFCALVCTLALLMSPVSANNVLAADQEFVGEDNEKLVLTLISPESKNIVTNKLDIEFELSYSGEPITYDDVEEGLYTVTSKEGRIVGNYGGSFLIEDFTLTKPGETEIEIEVERLVQEDDEGDDFEPLDDSITITLNYYNMESAGAEFTTPFQTGKKVTAFNGNVLLEFPVGSFITNSYDTQTIAPEQTLHFKVENSMERLNSGVTPSDGYSFRSPSYFISDGTNDNDNNFSKPGKITLSFAGSGIAKDVAMYNISIARLTENGQWYPIGGYVDSKKSTVSATIPSFGTYAVIYSFKTYRDLENWAAPALMSLAYKGIVEATGSNGLLRDNLASPINRYDYTVMISKAMNWSPVPYDSYFADISDAHYSSIGKKQVNTLKVIGQSNVDQTLKITFGDTLSLPAETFHTHISKGDTPDVIARKIAAEATKIINITREYNITSTGNEVIFTSIDKENKGQITLTMEKVTNTPIAMHNLTAGNGNTPGTAFYSVTNNVYASSTLITITDNDIEEDEAGNNANKDVVEFTVQTDSHDTAASVLQKIKEKAQLAGLDDYYNISISGNQISFISKNPANVNIRANARSNTDNSVRDNTTISYGEPPNSIGSNRNSNNYIMAALVNGLIQGKRTDSSGRNYFDPDGHLSREEAAVIVARALQLKVSSYTEKDLESLNSQLNKTYTDYVQISNWAKPFVVAVTKAGIMKGESNMFKPQNRLEYQEAATLVYRIMLEKDLFGK
ncbi:S-layer homology domain-containing protein [Ammoniphilus sp. CFH 90114]|uniref:S-layer homology domain-containing protein n=1 Tax=Ammoniphilus sp. CFH 90114 TaxID=2493665 RepID=UPI00100F2D74|nr:S-layer homology domain-containing protein [Ammoniphilus sp. CFH 90114]RXT03986.1 hypothetical protein EIZ39_21740 [Ammoniphilus sp. CFH 90114]